MMGSIFQSIPKIAKFSHNKMEIFASMPMKHNRKGRDPPIALFATAIAKVNKKQGV